MQTLLYLLSAFSLVLLAVAGFALQKNDLKSCLFAVLMSFFFFMVFTMLVLGGNEFNFPPNPEVTNCHGHSH